VPGLLLVRFLRPLAEPAVPVSRWTAEVTAQKVTAQAKLRATEGRMRMTEDEITSPKCRRWGVSRSRWSQ
jgi:hypothetical protein